MKREPNQPPVWAARGVIAGAVFLFGLALPALALAQEEEAGEQPEETAPAAEGAEGTAIDPETLEVVPVGEQPTAEAEAAPAGEKDTTQLDTIEVTGSRIKRTDYETAQPVLVINREDIERTGLTNIGDILQRIPSAGSALNRVFNNGGNGQTEIDLRNLGSQRVLVLVNGHRWVSGTSFAGTSSVDLNTIPVSIIERIEVLKDGASAIYGSDAITGVVNVITRKDFTGAEVRTQVTGFADGPSAAQQQYSLSFGSISGKTSLFVDANYVRQNELFADARDLSKVPQFGTGHTRGSLFTPRGTIIWFTDDAHAGPLNAAGGNPGEPPPCVSTASLVVGDAFPTPVAGAPGQASFVCIMNLKPGETIRGSLVDPSENTNTVASRYEAFIKSSLDTSVNDAYNFAPINYLLTPFEQQSLFTQVNHQLLDNLAFTAQVLLNVSKTERNLAETPLLFGQGLGLPPPYNQIFIDSTNVFNPFDQDIGRDLTTTGVGPGAGIVARRFVELGPRFLARDVKTLMSMGSVNGNFELLDRLVSWDFGLASAVSENTNIHKGDLRLDTLKLALGPAATCAATLGCVPLNLFGGPGSITKEMLDYIKYEAVSSARSQTTDGAVNFSTELINLAGMLPYGLVDGPISVAFGGEYREEEFSEQPDPFTTTANSSTNLRKATGGGFDTKEGYVEFGLPVLADKPWVDTLDLSLAARNVSYDTFGSKLTGKLGVRYKPIDDLLIRSTVSEAFRAPAVTELFLGTTDSFPEVTDPCADPRRASNVDENCNAEGAPSTTQQLNAQILTRFGGNSNLEPETADTFTAGIVYSPHFLPDLNVYVDWYKIDLDDAIGFLDPQFILDTCYGRASGASRPTTCDFVHRDSNGSLTFIEALSLNLSSVSTTGLEVAFDYVLPMPKILELLNLGDRQVGALTVIFDSSYLDEYEQCTPNADGSSTCEGFAGLTVSNQPFPRFKANSALKWNFSNWEASWTIRYIGKSNEACTDAVSGLFGEPRLSELGLCSDPDFDLAVDKDGDGNSDDSRNELEGTFYHNVQLAYLFPDWNLTLTGGVVNLLDEDPARSTQAFANSFSATLYEVPGMQPYLKLHKSF